MLDPNRGTGRTTKQMLEAPQGAVFISSGRHSMSYDRKLSIKHGRSDLQIVASDWLTSRRWQGMLFTAIVVDHDVTLSGCERESLLMALTRVRSTRPLTENELLHRDIALKRAKE